MRQPEVPSTPAVHALRAAGVEFVPHFYAYVDRGGTRVAAEELHVPEFEVIKTIVLETQEQATARHGMLVLMHGDHEVSTKQVARFLGVKTIAPATEAGVTKYTGYLPGGVSPFGTRSALPVYVEETILILDRIYINGGKRGFLVEIHPTDLQRVLSVVPVNVGIPRERLE